VPLVLVVVAYLFNMLSWLVVAVVVLLAVAVAVDLENQTPSLYCHQQITL
jgi:lipopolysaccharide/colanic/teichoic acid biosynthesis glycosyltransferase